MIPDSIRSVITDQDALAWLNWAGFGIGVFGLLLSYYFYVNAERAKRPYCLSFTQTIAGHLLANVPDLKITFRGRPVPRLTITKLVFWNAGSETIHGTDVPAASPLRISLPPDAELLSHKLDFVKQPANAIAMNFEPGMNSIHVAFDYFDKNDGFVLEILHTATSDAAIEVKAIFKGARGLVRRSAAPLLSLPRWLRTFLATDQRSFAGLFLIVVAVVSWSDQQFGYLPWWLNPLKDAAPPRVPLTYFVEFLVYGSALAAGVYLFRTRLPKGFDLNW